MKKLTCLLLIFTACGLYAQRKPTIKGNRSVIEVNEDLPEFSAIEIRDDLPVILRKAASPAYALSMDDNLVDILKFSVEGNTLVISAFYKIRSSKKFEIIVDYRELTQITVHEGQLEMEDIITTDELSVQAFGVSRVQLKASAPVVHIAMQENSTADLHIDSDSLAVTLADRVDVKMYSTGDGTSITMEDHASATLEGTAGTFDVRLVGYANLKAEKLEAGKVKATLGESSTARVYAGETFELASRGSSKTFLFGNPEISLSEFLDASELHKKGD